MDNTNEKDDLEFEIKPTKAAVATVAAGILVIIAGFLLYNFFAKPSTPTQVSTTSGENTPEVQSASTPEASQAELQPAPSDVTTPTPAIATEPSTSQPLSASTSDWVALSHDIGSISGDTYTVQSGDTLWELSQGRYGSGFDWQKIAIANNITYNDLGKPLIYPGQVLTLP
ncbi:MAG: LysM peptidoglycan-binding domain-containing protein [candidate division WWE3 bacterium]|nr:LysM peptidoglycan-binding domain-containing protein [candidate division WWE3 bacterium]